MAEPVQPAGGGNEQALQAEIARLNKMILALMNRAERNASIHGSDFNLFHTAITLEDQVRRRTAELEAALLENEKITRALRTSENRHRLLVENSPMCIHEIDMNGRIASMNRAGLGMMGINEEREVQGYLYLDAVCEADRERIAEMLAKAYAGETRHFEFKADGAGGQMYKSCFVPIKDKNGSVEKLMGITEDITERKRIETALSDMNRDFVSFLENTTDFIYFKDADSRFRFCSQTLADITGHASWRDMTGKHDLEVFPEDTARIYHEEELPIYRDGIPMLDKTDPYYDAQGKQGWVSTNKWPVFDKEGTKVIGLFGISRDITEHKNLEQQLTEREALFRTIFEQADFGIELIDPDSLQFVEVNPAVCRMLGYTREELLRMYLEDTQVDMDRKALLASVRQIEEVGGASFPNRHRCKNGDILDVEINAHILQIAGKRLLVGLWRDVTAQKRVQEEIKFKNTILQTQQETSPDAVLVVDENGKIISFNRQFVELWHVPAQLLSSKDDGPVLMSVVEQVAEPEAFFARVQYLYEHSDEKSHEEIALKDGRVIERYSAPATGTDGKYYGRVWYFRDITERKQAEENLLAKEREFRTLTENSPGNIARFDCAGHLLYANPALERTLGANSAEFLGKTPTEFMPGEFLDAYQKAILQVVATGEPVNFEQIIPTGEGRPHVHSIQIVPELGPDGVPLGVLAVGHDISEIKWAEESLRITASVFENSQEGIVITDADNHFLDVNPAFTRITGYTREEALGGTPSLLNSGRHDKTFYAAMWQSLAQKRVWRGEMWNRRKSGEIYPELLSIAAICDDKGSVQRYVGVFSDISYIKAHELELSRIAHYDALTGIPNRLLLADRLTQAMAASKRSLCYGAVIFLDLDNFKSLNDTHGHEMGDLLLIEVARRLTHCVREMDTVARFGGDEFVVILGELDVNKERSAEQAANVAEKIRVALAEPYVLVRNFCQLNQPEGGGEVAPDNAVPADSGVATPVEHQCTSSIGVVLFVGNEASQEDILKWADRAMYQAKEGGRDRVRFFSAKS